MRKVIVSMNITLDGFMAGPDAGLNWHFSYWNEEMARVAGEQLHNADTLLLGRITYEAMAGYWPSVVAGGCPREDIAFADMMNNHLKVVFSKTLKEAKWNNARLVAGNARKEILKLKQAPGKDMLVYGSGILVNRLMRLDLVDEYIFWVHPVVIGKGYRFFKDPRLLPRLRLLNTKALHSGVIMLHYRADGLS